MATTVGKNIATSIIVEYSHLVSGKNLHSTIEQAYGPEGNSDIMKGWGSYSSMEFLGTQSSAKIL